MVKQSAPRRAPAAGLVMIIAFLIFGISVAAFVFAFAYRFTLLEQTNSPCPDASADSDRGCGLLATLERERQRLDPERLAEFRRVHTKINLAEEVVNKHATLVPMFALLNETTLQTIQYNKFTFSPEGVVIEGSAAAYEDIALQSREFSKHKDRIKTFIFSDLNLDASGDVSFKLQMTINPDILSYRSYWQTRPSGFQRLPAENETQAEATTTDTDNVNVLPQQ